MKKTLVVMRHGKAMPSAQTQQDIDRTLTKAGAWALEARLPRMLRLLEVGDDTAHIWAGLDRDGERITAICAIDNLVKGTAGAAIQSLNCALSLPENTGLIVNGVAP